MPAFCIKSVMDTVANSLEYDVKFPVPRMFTFKELQVNVANAAYKLVL